MRQELRRIWRIYKTKFAVRFLINCIIVLSISYFRLFPNGPIGTFLTFAFLISTELFLATYLPLVASNIYLMWNHRKKVVWISMPQELETLAKRMNVLGKIKKFGVYPGLRNAYVMDKSVIIGEELLRDLDKDEVLAIMAHEFNHIRGRHSLIKALFPILIFPIIIFSGWQELPYFMYFMGSFVLSMTVMIPLNINSVPQLSIRKISYHSIQNPRIIHRLLCARCFFRQ